MGVIRRRLTEGLILLVVATLFLGGCAPSNGVEVSGLNRPADGRFAYEYMPPTTTDGGYSFGRVIDMETGVIYITFRTDNGMVRVGGITPLLNSDGTPMVDMRMRRYEKDDA